VGSSRKLGVDGSTAFVPGDDYGEDEGQDAWPQEEEEEFQATPSPMGRSSSTQRSKRSFASTSSTLTSPVKKSKSPMVKIVKDIANTFKESVTVNTKQIQKRASENDAFSVRSIQRCYDYLCSQISTSTIRFAT